MVVLDVDVAVLLERVDDLAHDKSGERERGEGESQRAVNATLQRVAHAIQQLSRQARQKIFTPRGGRPKI